MTPRDMLTVTDVYYTATYPFWYKETADLDIFVDDSTCGEGNRIKSARNWNLTHITMLIT